ncbi:MAG: hypothetical protein KDD02_07060 [Phaeodactylibacter sp.]|nr:hypothetical protein [Phaeodactylibacter sp.]
MKKLMLTFILGLSLLPFAFRFQGSEIIFFMMRDAPFWALMTASLSALALMLSLRLFSRATLLALTVFFTLLPCTMVLNGSQPQWIIWAYLPFLALPYWIASLAAFVYSRRTLE